MRVLVAGATSVFGLPLMEELRGAGHEVYGLTRSRARVQKIEGCGASSVIADVFDGDGLSIAVAETQPDAVISLLITLPKNGPMRPSQVHPNLRLWDEGVPNLIAAARDAGAGRFLAESFVFAYGYGQYGPEPLTEDDELEGGAVIRGQAQILNGLRGMERAVLDAEGLEGLVLRYGGRHGVDMPMTTTMVRALCLGVPVLPGGGHALLPFIEVEDSAHATVAALERGRGKEIYNIVDDRPSEMREYAEALASAIGARRPRSIPLPLVKVFAPYMACILDHTRLPVSNEKAKRTLDWQPRFSSAADAVRAYWD